MTYALTIADKLREESSKRLNQINKLERELMEIQEQSVTDIVSFYTQESSEDISFNTIECLVSRSIMKEIALKIMEHRNLRATEVDSAFLKLLLTNPNSKDHIIRKEFEKTFESLSEKAKFRVSLFCHDNCITSEVCDYIRIFLKRNFRIEVLPIISTGNQLELHHPLPDSNQAQISLTYEYGSKEKLSIIGRDICFITKLYESPTISIKFPCIGRVRCVDLVIRDSETGNVRHPVVAINNGDYIYETTGNTYEEKIYDALTFITGRLNDMAA